MRGAALGGLFAIAIAIGFAIGGSGIELSRTEIDLAMFVAVWSLPLSIGFGAAAAGESKRFAKLTPVLRWCAYVVVAIITMTVATPFWIVIVPWAFGVTLLFALAFELWFVRPHLVPRPKPPRDPTRAAIEKGAVLGASTGLGIAIAHAFAGQSSRYCGLLDCPWFVDPGPTAAQLFAAVAMHAVPIAILWGCFVGWVAHAASESRWRPVAVVWAAFTGLWIFSIGWPELLVNGLGIGFVHCALLLSWTRREPIPEAPVAILIDRPRSTCSRGARSTAPTPRRSGTSRTTRSA